MANLTLGGLGMNFELTKEQEMIRDMVRDFAEKRLNRMLVRLMRHQQ